METKTVCVIGAGGYIASWIVADLLKRGYKVHGTVRDPGNSMKYGHLKSLEGAAERLTLFKADLLDRASLVPAIRGCYGVFHTACPVFAKFDNPDDVLIPAIEGTENVLRVCHEENMKRVVFTSSCAAVVEDPNRPKEKVIDESCWSDPEYCAETEKWYRVGKTQSEKLAWKLSRELNLDLVAVLPVYVLGPMLHPGLNTSMEPVKSLVDGSSESYPNRYDPIVDVRDTAEVHIRAFENPNASGRYICMAKVVHYEDIVRVIKKNFPYLPCPDKSEGEVQGEVKWTNKKVKELLPEFIPFERTIVDGIHCLIDKGFIANTANEV